VHAFRHPQTRQPAADRPRVRAVGCVHDLEPALAGGERHRQLDLGRPGRLAPQLEGRIVRPRVRRAAHRHRSCMGSGSSREMPVYEFACLECGNQWNAATKQPDIDLKAMRCPRCEGKLIEQLVTTSETATAPKR
jgi:putative FmdB family regulatory protein